MSFRIDLGELANATFTANDTVRGKLLAQFDSQETIREITVKLEGVSYSRVPVPQHEHEALCNNENKPEKQRHALEVHRFLYDTVVVFPPRRIGQASTSNQFTLPAGNHSFDFSFQIPAGTDCIHLKQPGSDTSRRLTDECPRGEFHENNDTNCMDHYHPAGTDCSHIGQPRWDTSRRSVNDYERDNYHGHTATHFMGPLPPALSDMNDIASVRYFLKATIHRSSHLKMNIRVYTPIVYISPDIIDSNVRLNEIRFARRRVSVLIHKPFESSINEKKEPKQPAPAQQPKSFLSSWFSSSAESSTDTGPRALPLMLDMRFSNYFNPTKTLPIHLYVLNLGDAKKLPDSLVLYIDELTFKLYATTDTKAQIYNKQHIHSLTVFECKYLGLKLPLADFKPATVPQLSNVSEIEIPPSLWEKVRIPDTVAPSFQICNIKREYSFEVIAGLKTAPDAKPKYVSVAGNMRLLSGLVSNTTITMPSFSQIEGSNSNNTITDNSGNTSSSAEDLPPSYSEVISSGSLVQSVENPPDFQTLGSDPSDSMSRRFIQNSRRRTYQQSDFYYSRFESADPDTQT